MVWAKEYSDHQKINYVVQIHGDTIISNLF
jgi:hypothetical protein